MNEPITPERLNELAEKWLKGTISEEERHLLDNWYNRNDRIKDLVEWESEDHDEEHLADRMYKSIASEISVKKRSLTFVNSAIVRVAAILVVVVSVGLYYYYSNPVKYPAANSQSVHQKTQPIVPGGNKAMLTLANGRTILLDDAFSGEIARETGIRIRKLKEGQLVYEVLGDEASKNLGKMINTISTPKGGQYQVVLPDGSKVWLNAASSLKFPAVFLGDTREVELVGEGYFEIHKNKQKPFLVKARGMHVEVLGTHFNVMAYPDEQSVKTTLLEGAVKVVKNELSKTLIPGEQADVIKNIKVLKVDTEESIAWKNGSFLFTQENIESVMRKISRWYDVDVVYEGTLTKEGFMGSISKYDNLDRVLKTLEYTGLVKFRIEGRRVIVTN